MEQCSGIVYCRQGNERTASVHYWPSFIYYSIVCISNVWQLRWHFICKTPKYCANGMKMFQRCEVVALRACIVNENALINLQSNDIEEPPHPQPHNSETTTIIRHLFGLEDGQWSQCTVVHGMCFVWCVLCRAQLQTSTAYGRENWNEFSVK